eukprot:Seg1721.2 transcript_id=Seg1721.2/GoldUCD/mRNA.D3Y31 product="ATP-dependent RNA helicase DEAH12" protein_id=Seg1721.2/GoldUCD/D3Y31
MSTELTSTTKDGPLSGLFMDMKLTEEGDECEACFNAPEDKQYRLINCGHLFCLPCLKQLIELCIQDDNFPIPCCKDGCDKSLSKMDAFKLFTLHKFQWDSFQYISSNFKKLVLNGNGSSKTYRTCPTPTCRRIYSVPESAAEVMCGSCKTKICTACKKHAHDGYSCTTWETRNDAKHVEIWAKTRGDIQQCPKCRIYIEKNGGCENMVCLCGTSFKWL